MLAQLKDHLEKLNHFAVIARQGSFRRAAEVLHLTQPTLSYSIKILEDVSGRLLFTRNSQGVHLTAAGSLLLEFCERYFAELSGLEQRLKSPHAEFAGSVRVGTYESLAVHFWPKFLVHFTNRYPDCALSFRSGLSADIKDHLIENKIDLGFAVEIPPHKDLVHTELFRDDYNFYLSPSSRFALATSGNVREEFTLSENAIPLLYVPFARSSENLDLNFYLSKKGLRSVSARFELESFEAVREFTLAGLGVGVMPKRLAKRHVTEGALVQVKMQGFAPEGFGNHRFVVASRAADGQNPLLQRLIHELVEDQGKSSTFW